jgi:hypothetical protein
MLKTTYMKRNAEKSPVEDNDQEPRLHIVETPRQGGGATALSLPAECHADQPRPEIAVLGWNVRSYRLALRENKV